MAKFTRRDFLIQDLAVSIGGGGRGTWMPGPDDETPPSPISPIASVIFNMPALEQVRVLVADAVKAKRLDDIGRAFDATDTGGNAAIRGAIQAVGTAIVGSVVYAGLGGAAGMPDPNCAGTSLETVPPTMTPVVNVGRLVHRVNDLPNLRRQLGETVAYLDKRAAAMAPRGAEVTAVRTHLEGVMRGLAAK